MAEALAQVVRFPWTAPNTTGDGKGQYKGFLSMKLGTYKYLFPAGLAGVDPNAATKTYDVGAKTYQRALYAGGPKITVTRKSQKITKSLTGRVSTAASEKKLILSERGVLGGSADTIHYTGHVYGAVAFLNQFAAPVAGGGVQIHGPHGQSYSHIDAVIKVPVI
jgi:hypothetical protein